MSATLVSLYRHPVKGFTPERLERAELTTGACFPFDRMYAVENGSSGFDPGAPAHISKMKFTVLAPIARVAAVRTAYDAASGRLTATAPGCRPFTGDLGNAADQAVFAAWLSEFLGEEASGPLRVLEGPGAHRFMDHPMGHVSIINLASVRDLAEKIGRPVDPLRFRANLYVEGWAPWAENDWKGRTLSIGPVQATAYKPIVRCAATEVDPKTAARDIDVPAALFEHYGHVLCGLYVNVARGGTIAAGDRIEVS